MRRRQFWPTIGRCSAEDKSCNRSGKVCGSTVDRAVDGAGTSAGQAGEQPGPHPVDQWWKSLPPNEKPGPGPGSRERRQGADHRRADHFRELLIDSNLLLSDVPRPFTAAMIAREMPAAIKPYSMAVAPDSSRRNFKRKFVICTSFPA